MVKKILQEKIKERLKNDRLSKRIWVSNELFSWSRFKYLVENSKKAYSYGRDFVVYGWQHVSYKVQNEKKCVYVYIIEHKAVNRFIATGRFFQRKPNTPAEEMWVKRVIINCIRTKQFYLIRTYSENDTNTKSKLTDQMTVSFDDMRFLLNDYADSPIQGD